MRWLCISFVFSVVYAGVCGLCQGLRTTGYSRGKIPAFDTFRRFPRASPGWSKCRIPSVKNVHTALAWTYIRNSLRSRKNAEVSDRVIRKALAILARDDRFKSTIYAINTLLIHKGIYSQRKFQQHFVATRATATTSITRNTNKARSLL